MIFDELWLHLIFLDQIAYVPCEGIKPNVVHPLISGIFIFIIFFFMTAPILMIGFLRTPFEGSSHT